MNQRRNIIEQGSLLGPHHRVETILGEGSFGVVARCRDTRTNRSVAVKVSKPNPNIFHQTRIEIENLKRLRHLDPEDAHIIDWQDFFFHGRNICMTFELLDLSLEDYMKHRRGEEDLCPGLPLTEVRGVLHQMSSALSHLSSVGMVHSDIKPENIMVVNRNEKPVKVKLIDFGLSLPLSDCKPGVCAGTLVYMAPEMILGAPFNEAIDMWSLGQTAVEIITGFIMYDARNPYDVIRCIVETQGQPPDSVLDQGVNTEQAFREVRNGSQWVWKFKTPEDIHYNPVETRKFFLRSLDDLLDIIEWQRGHHGDHIVLLDLIKKMLSLDPRQRIKPLEVLQHPFFTGNLPQSEDVFNETKNIEDVISKDQWGSEDQTAGPEEKEIRVQTENLTQEEENEVEEFTIQQESSQPEEHKELEGEDEINIQEPERDDSVTQPENIFLAEEAEEEVFWLKEEESTTPSGANAQAEETEEEELRIQPESSQPEEHEELEEKESTTPSGANAQAEEIENEPVWIQREEEPEIVRIHEEEVQPEKKKRVGFFRRVLNRIRKVFRSSKRSKSPK